MSVKLKRIASCLQVTTFYRGSTPRSRVQTKVIDGYCQSLTGKVTYWWPFLFVFLKNSMRKVRTIYIIFSYLLFPAILFGRQSLKAELESIKGLTVKEIKNPLFRECFEIMVEQPLDH